MTTSPDERAGTDVSADSTLLRRIHRTFVVSDGAGGLTLSRQAFRDLRDPDGTEAMSVYVEERLLELGADAAVVLEGFPEHGMAAVPSSAVRACGLGVVWAPTDDGVRGQAHANVFGSKTKPVQRALIAASTMRVLPQGA
jgi:hypothetical protein